MARRSASGRSTSPRGRADEPRRSKGGRAPAPGPSHARKDADAGRSSRRDPADPVERAVAAAAEGQDALLRPGARVLVAFSGGADSTALLASLGGFARRRADLGLHLEAGHVDHGLRPESRADAAHARAVSARLGIPLHVARLRDLKAAVAREGLEAAARRARHDALAGLAEASGADVVATGHTRRDQAETLLLRLARGAGPGALAGVRRSRALVHGVRLVRPLLSVTRADTEAYCAAHGLPYLSDPHNDDPARARSRVRRAFDELAGLLNPRLEEALAGAADLLADEDDLLSSMTRDLLAKATSPSGLSAEVILSAHPALQRRALLAAATAAQGRPERGHLEALRELLARPRERGPASLDFPGARALLRRGRLLFCKPAPRGRSAARPPGEVAEVVPSS